MTTEAPTSGLQPADDEKIMPVVWNLHPPLHSECDLLVREAELLGFQYHLWRHGALVLVGEEQKEQEGHGKN